MPPSVTLSYGTRWTMSMTTVPVGGWEARSLRARLISFKNEGMRKGRRLGRLQEEGKARVEPDGSLFIYLHSLPVGGFDGRIRCYRIGTKPPEETPIKYVVWYQRACAQGG